MSKSIIKLENVNKIYENGKKKVQALSNINLDFELGKFYAITGHSGSGKSTLLQIIGLIRTKTTGSYTIFNNDVDKMDENEKTLLRNKYIGYIFQDYYLDEDISAIDNVMLPYYISKKTDYKEKKKEVIKMFEDLNISSKTDITPRKLSSGEKARVSFMRALVNDPKIILADEPTGNLDKDNEKKIFELLKEESKKGKCVIVVSHSREVFDYCDNKILIENGVVSYE